MKELPLISASEMLEHAFSRAADVFGGASVLGAIVMGCVFAYIALARWWKGSAASRPTGSSEAGVVAAAASSPHSVPSGKATGATVRRFGEADAMTRSQRIEQTLRWVYNDNHLLLLGKVTAAAITIWCALILLTIAYENFWFIAGGLAAAAVLALATRQLWVMYKSGSY